MYVDISLAHKTSLYVDIEFQTIQDTSVYGHKHQTYLYVDVELQTNKYQIYSYPESLRISNIFIPSNRTKYEYHTICC